AYNTETNEIEIYNLKVAATYYWTVTQNGRESEIKTFKTCSNAPRVMNVDGVTNVRDLGGWETESGVRTNQNLIFRCGRLNESSAETPVIEITEAGKEVMLYELGIKTEIDLRKTDTNEVGGITQSPLGSSVQYFSCPMEWEGDTFNGNKEQLLKVFSILADEKNYPVIFHCNIGTDRTGMIAFLVNALLGVSDDDLHRDYLFSNFGKIGGARKASGLEESVYYKSVAEAEGDTLSEKTYNCLVAFGVPAEQLDAIRDILLPQ
ncbi:MAG: tyrosine-protein phosphatase, partial [Eubacterium sp.]|nr:tyrosine-protein phosphatase [Eubacterium sp.]